MPEIRHGRAIRLRVEREGQTVSVPVPTMAEGSKVAAAEVARRHGLGMYESSAVPPSARADAERVVAEGQRGWLATNRIGQPLALAVLRRCSHLPGHGFAVVQPPRTLTTQPAQRQEHRA